MVLQHFLYMILLTMCLVGSAFLITSQKRKLNEVTDFLKTPQTYAVEIKNDHTVYFTNTVDTIMVHFENAYALSEESIVFIKHK